MTTKIIQNLLYKDLSYQIQGAAIEVRKNFGPGHKESIYQNAFAEELKSRGINFEKEKNIKIYSPKTNKVIGYYKPDFIIDNKIIIELKAVEKIPRMFIDQLYDYLKNSEYELGYFINFASPKLYMKRIIFTNDRKFFKLNNVLLVVLSFVLVSISVLPANAANLNLVSQTNEIGVGSQFQIDLMLDAEGQDINAAQGNIIFPKNLLEIKEIYTGSSIINFWIEKPQINAEIKFSGVIPGGFSGVLSPYYKGYKPGKVLSLIFTAKKEGVDAVEIHGAKVLLNDGKGTETNTTISNFQFLISKQTPSSKLQVPSSNDTNPPELFTPEIARDPDIFGGKWFLVFAAQDKGSGIDYYAAHESARTKEAARIDAKNWTVAESPYVLKDQKLKSYIYVKAVDKAGNERFAVLPPKFAPWYKKPLVDTLVGLIALVVLLLIVRWLWRKYRKIISI